MKVHYKDNNTTLVYSKGATREDIITYIQERIEKRQAELNKRQWVVDEYNRISEKQKQDIDWLDYIKRHPEFLKND